MSNLNQSELTQLAQRFEQHRSHLRGVALRMLGSTHEADDALQEAWLRLCRTDAEALDNLGGWLTTVVARICLDMLRQRGTRRALRPDEITETATPTTPEDEALLADAVGIALLVVLDTLTPPERLAFVLHDLFALPFEEIAPIVGRSPVAARQLASRARRRLQSDPAFPGPSAAAQREVVTAFLAAAHDGDFMGLVGLLDPDAILRADAVAIEMNRAHQAAGAPRLEREMRGAEAVAKLFGGGARAARLTLVDGVAGAMVSVGGQPFVVFDFVVRAGRVVGIELLADPQTIEVLELEPLRSTSGQQLQGRSANSTGDNPDADAPFRA